MKLTSDKIDKLRTHAQIMMKHPQGGSNTALQVEILDTIHALCELADQLPKTTDSLPIVPGDVVWLKSFAGDGTFKRETCLAWYTGDYYDPHEPYGNYYSTEEAATEGKE